MASIKERAAALNLAEKLCVRPQAHGAASKPAQSSSMWSGIISHLRSCVAVKRRRLHLKSHSDCFLGSDAVDVVAEYITAVKGFKDASVSRDKIVCVCQALLDCSVFETVGTKVFGKDRKQAVFQDSRSALYRFVSVCPSVDELERGALVEGIQKLFCSGPSDGTGEWTCPTGPHVQMSSPVKLAQTSIKVDQLDSPASASLSVRPPADSLSPSLLPQSLVDEVWHEQTLLRLLNVVELPVLEGLLHCNETPPPPSRLNLLPHNNPDLIYSSNHLDRQILKAFRDSQEDEWLCAALDCLDFLPDQPVVELSRELSLCLNSCEKVPAHSSSQCGGKASVPSLMSASTPDNEHPCLSHSTLAQCKLLLYGMLVKHYSHAESPPLLPQHMTNIYTAITDLLVDAKFDAGLEALQLCLKLLPSTSRDELRRLLTFMALAADPQGIKLDKEMENRLAVKRSFSRVILHNKGLSKDKEDLMVVFMLSNIKDIFKIPGALHKGVSDKLASLVQGKQPLPVTGSTFCQPVSSKTYTDSTKNTTNQELWALLNRIHLDNKIATKERKRLLGQFYQAHPQIFNQYFGESAVSVL